MSQSVRVRSFHHQTLLLLKKPAQQIVLDKASLDMFLEMLAEPYPLEDNQLGRLRDVESVRVSVGALNSKKLALCLNPPSSIVSMDTTEVRQLTQQISAAQVAA